MEVENSEKPKHNEETMTKDNSTIAMSKSDSPASNNVKSSNSDLSCHEDQNVGDDGIEDDDDVSNCDDYDDDDDDMYYDDEDEVEDDNEYDYASMQAHFDNVDLPAGVEATVSWMEKPAPSSKPSSQGCSSISMVSEQSSSHEKKEELEDDVMDKYKDFKHFDMVDDFSDHHYSNMGFQGQQPPKAWAKKVQDEWKILEKDLPDTIYVRVYEARLDLLRAVIIGPQGTPYHDGLFVFDILFPQTYPHVPPMVYYYSGGLRLNPNLYDCGKVCLSLLNTWTGKANEKWMPQTSTMLQVLVSIQALILNSRPFFNEPGYEESYPGAQGVRQSNAYNQDVFILSLKTMTYTLRRPPKHFEDFVIGHFRFHAQDILSACKAYVEGARVGSLVKGKVQGVGDSATQDGRSREFKEAVSRMMKGLISLLTKNGAKDLERYRV